MTAEALFGMEAIIALAVVVLLGSMIIPGCAAPPKHKAGYEKVIPYERRAEAARWIQETVKAANPMSDEEPEDNIAQAEETAENLFGKTTIGLLFYNGSYYGNFVPYEELNDQQKDVCDAFQKGQP